MHYLSQKYPICSNNTYIIDPYRAISVCAIINYQGDTKRDVYLVVNVADIVYSV